MSYYRIQGPATLSGRFRPSGNKNAALPILAGCLLAREPVRLHNVPDIGDVRTLLDLLRTLGVEADWTAPRELTVRATDSGDPEMDPELAGRIRASILLAGPALARFGSVVLPPPGGDVIGRRRLDTHFLALRSLGAEVELGDRYYLRASRLVGHDLFLDEPSVTATENALLAAVTADGVTVIRNAAAEPHVQDLCRFLATIGARIEGIGTHALRIDGVDRLGGGEHTIGADHIEIGSVIGLAAATGSQLLIDGVEPGHLDPLRIGFQRLGLQLEISGDTLEVDGRDALEIQLDAGNQIPRLDDGPWPAFPADLISIALVVATQCRGTILIHEKMFESRMFFVDKVIAMGGRVILCDPHRAVVAGPSRLRGARLESPDIRAGMALLIAALAAEGESTIHNIRQIERGYESIEKRLVAIGADIERVDTEEPDRDRTDGEDPGGA